AWSGGLPPGVEMTLHDPEDRAGLAYLASTNRGRRVYLNRLLTDADCVVPVGQLGYDPVLGYRGPWGVVFPGLSDAETRRAYRAQAAEGRPDREHDRPTLIESDEVSWLLGSQFHVGIVAGRRGVAGAIAGVEAAVRTEGTRRVDAAWGFQAKERAEVVVAGVGGGGGGGGGPTTLDELAEGLATATNLVRRGGKIVLLSRAEGPLGPAMQRLIGAEEGAGMAALRGAEREPDYPCARRLARALAWADVYLMSELPEDQVEDLSIIGISRPEEARRLAAVGGDSCLFISQADLTRAEVADESE
ncbi:MAG: DUF2088 domain-containing protein, partial [Isosphaeraceae bacterium]|nr:DUF2088 domain-containing protein [Isosphaeraceae bacterium]